MRPAVRHVDASATPRQIRYFAALCLIRGMKRPKRGVMDRLIKKLELLAGRPALARLRKIWCARRRARRARRALRAAKVQRRPGIFP